MDTLCWCVLYIDYGGHFKIGNILGMVLFFFLFASDQYMHAAVRTHTNTCTQERRWTERSINSQASGHLLCVVVVVCTCFQHRSTYTKIVYAAFIHARMCVWMRAGVRTCKYAVRNGRMSRRCVCVGAIGWRLKHKANDALQKDRKKNVVRALHQLPVKIYAYNRAHVHTRSHTLAHQTICSHANTYTHTFIRTHALPSSALIHKVRISNPTEQQQQ